MTAWSVQAADVTEVARPTSCNCIVADEKESSGLPLSKVHKAPVEELKGRPQILALSHSLSPSMKTIADRSIRLELSCSSADDAPMPRERQNCEPCGSCPIGMLTKCSGGIAVSNKITAMSFW